MNINEIIELTSDDSPERRDTLMSLENEYTLKPNPIKWLKLNKFYNWDNVFNEILYFYETHNDRLYAISFGGTIDGEYLIVNKMFKYDSEGNLSFSEGVWDDPWEIPIGSLELSDSSSLIDLIKNIFTKTLHVEDELNF